MRLCGLVVAHESGAEKAGRGGWGRIENDGAPYPVHRAPGRPSPFVVTCTGPSTSALPTSYTAIQHTLTNLGLDSSQVRGEGGAEGVKERAYKYLEGIL